MSPDTSAVDGGTEQRYEAFVESDAGLAISVQDEGFVVVFGAQLVVSQIQHHSLTGHAELERRYRGHFNIA